MKKGFQNLSDYQNNKKKALNVINLGFNINKRFNLGTLSDLNTNNKQFIKIL